MNGCLEKITTIQKNSHCFNYCAWSVASKKILANCSAYLDYLSLEQTHFIIEHEQFIDFTIEPMQALHWDKDLFLLLRMGQSLCELVCRVHHPQHWHDIMTLHCKLAAATLYCKQNVTRRNSMPLLQGNPSWNDCLLCNCFVTTSVYMGDYFKWDNFCYQSSPPLLMVHWYELISKLSSQVSTKLKKNKENTQSISNDMQLYSTLRNVLHMYYMYDIHKEMCHMCDTCVIHAWYIIHVIHIHVIHV